MIKGPEKFASVAAVTSAFASLACCLPWGIAAVLGSAGIGMSLERHRSWLIALSIVLLGFGAYSVVRQSRSCRRLRTGPTILILCSAIVVFVIAIFPDAAARFLVEHFH